MSLINYNDAASWYSYRSSILSSTTIEWGGLEVGDVGNEIARAEYKDEEKTTCRKYTFEAGEVGLETAAKIHLRL